MPKECEKRSYSNRLDSSLRQCNYAYARSRAISVDQGSRDRHKYRLATLAEKMAVRHRNEELSEPSQPSPNPLSLEAERLRPEFTVLADQWRRDTRHLSLVSKKITHPTYFRIIGMGKPVAPLLLEALRDRPAHWFAALRAVTNADPAGPEANPSEARQAWLEWGKSEGYTD
jgi:hypothetical protein